MQSVLIVVHLMIVVALVVTVLLQRSEGGALGVGGGGGFMTGRGQANVLTRATAILAALFFATSLGLTILARVNQAPSSIIQHVAPATKPAANAPPGQPASPGGGLLDQLKQIEDQRQSSPPPAQPASPLAPPN
ncbi:Preprotein translocase, SecG subunit [Methylocella tundrae]|uniref:Protein-export membrane protein SecG n=1 Tax=Methylocella tundrae TaxID=227605 RepID=A0A8B6MCQ3_METTU|nr:preprotein translocase subunit SecG [Methylocella tundrae]VTZ21220.1 Protein-export membrane protein SecG [Methylocella tundrae]VTZ52425.1 Preprotein translocase, SecG subunit [Methylocella tundrae]